ncbi:MAG: hypothetical protein ACRDV9_01710 [Acidimicrobiia bacterium]
MRTTAWLGAVGAAGFFVAGCSGGGSAATPEQVAVNWLGAKAAYDGGAEWDLEAPPYRAGRTREQAAQERQREQAQECPTSDASGCLFPSGIDFQATGQRPEGDCLRVFVRTREPDGRTSDGAVTVMRVDDNWRVRDWQAVLPEDELIGGAARDCGVR